MNTGLTDRRGHQWQEISGIEMGSAGVGGRNCVLQQEGGKMAFVVEKIPESEKSKLNYVVKPFFSTTKWAIDRERDAFMVLTNSYGGPYDGTQETDYYTLNWGGELIEIIADLLSETFPEQGPMANWRVHWLKLPPSMKDRRVEVLQLVSEAFRAIGTCFNGDRFVAVNVNFDLPSGQ